MQRVNNKYGREQLEASDALPTLKDGSPAVRVVSTLATLACCLLLSVAGLGIGGCSSAGSSDKGSSSPNDPFAKKEQVASSPSSQKDAAPKDDQKPLGPTTSAEITPPEKSPSQGEKSYVSVFNEFKLSLAAELFDHLVVQEYDTRVCFSLGNVQLFWLYSDNDDGKTFRSTDGLKEQHYQLGNAGTGYQSMIVKLACLYMDVSGQENALEEDSDSGLAVQQCLGMTLEDLVSHISLGDFQPGDNIQIAKDGSEGKWKPCEGCVDIGRFDRSAEFVQDAPNSGDTAPTSTGPSRADYEARLAAIDNARAADPRFGGNNTQMIESGNDFTEQYTVLMDEVYNAALAQPGVDTGQLVASQDAWKSQTELKVSEAAADMQGGSMTAISMLGVRMTETHDRIVALLEYF